jgi:hypothetical protein
MIVDVMTMLSILSRHPVCGVLIAGVPNAM